MLCFVHGHLPQKKQWLLSISGCVLMANGCWISLVVACWMLLGVAVAGNLLVVGCWSLLSWFCWLQLLFIRKVPKVLLADKSALCAMRTGSMVCHLKLAFFRNSGRVGIVYQYCSSYQNISEFDAVGVGRFQTDGSEMLRNSLASETCGGLHCLDRAGCDIYNGLEYGKVTC